MNKMQTKKMRENSENIKTEEVKHDEVCNRRYKILFQVRI